MLPPSAKRTFKDTSWCTGWTTGQPATAVVQVEHRYQNLTWDFFCLKNRNIGHQPLYPNRPNSNLNTKIAIRYYLIFGWCSSCRPSYKEYSVRFRDWSRSGSRISSANFPSLRDRPFYASNTNWKSCGWMSVTFWSGIIMCRVRR